MGGTPSQGPYSPSDATGRSRRSVFRDFEKMSAHLSGDFIMIRAERSSCRRRVLQYFVFKTSLQLHGQLPDFRVFGAELFDPTDYISSSEVSSPEPDPYILHRQKLGPARASLTSVLTCLSHSMKSTLDHFFRLNRTTTQHTRARVLCRLVALPRFSLRGDL